VGNLKAFIDITKRKEAEEALRQKALRYKIEDGGSYLVTEKVLDRGMDVFKDLLQAGYKGMAISRTPQEEITGQVGEEVDVIWLSEKKKGKGAMPPQLNLLEKAIEDFISRKSVVLLDRLDYLVVQNGFNEVLKFIQELTEMAYMAKAVLLVVIDPGTLAGQEFSLLDKELKKIVAKYQVELEKELLDILKFIKSENEEGRMPARKDVAAAFSITRPTTIKRLNELKRKSLVEDRKRGRFKYLVITQQGREVL